MVRWSCVLAGCLAAGIARPAGAAGVDVLVTRAEEAAQAGSADAQQAAAALIDALRTSHAAHDQRQLLDGIVSLGRPDAAVPVALKRWVRANATGPVLDLAGSDADWTVRGQAFTVLRDLEPPDDVLRRAIGIAEADHSPQARFIHSRGVILQSYLEDRASAPDGPVKAGSDQQTALEWLRAHDIRVSYDALATAIGQADPAAVAALGEAGIGVGPGNASKTYNAVLNGLSTACAADTLPNNRIAPILRTLQARGFPLGYTDDAGNTLILSAAQFCPAAVVEDLVLLGTPVDPVNRQHFTPLKMALVSGKWDMAKVLVDAGAHLSKKDASEIFFAPPDKADQRALLERAAQ